MTSLIAVATTAPPSAGAKRTAQTSHSLRESCCECAVQWMPLADVHPSLWWAQLSCQSHTTAAADPSYASTVVLDAAQLLVPEQVSFMFEEQEHCLSLTGCISSKPSPELKLMTWKLSLRCPRIDAHRPHPAYQQGSEPLLQPSQRMPQAKHANISVQNASESMYTSFLFRMTD
jgi:hypothetical protein